MGEEVSPFYINTLSLNLKLEQFCQGFQVDRCEYLNRDNSRISSYVDDFTRRQFVRLEHFVYCSEPQKETHEVKYPKGWWNAFKAEHPRLCKWLKPAEYHTVTVQWTGKIAFPGLASLSRLDSYKTVTIWDKDMSVDFV